MDKWASISFTSLITKYSQLQSTVLKNIKSLQSKLSGTSPGAFLLIQFQMSTLTQIGETISNLIAQVNTIINNMVRNQKTQ